MPHKVFPEGSDGLGTWSNEVDTLTFFGTIPATGVPITLSSGGTGSSLINPGIDKIMYYNQTTGQSEWLGVGTNLTITDSTLNATGGGGGGTPAGNTGSFQYKASATEFGGANKFYLDPDLSTITMDGAKLIGINGSDIEMPYATFGGIGITNYQINTPASFLTLQATQGTIYSSGGIDIPVADGGTGSSTAIGARANLGLGSMSTQNMSTVLIAGGTITGITDLAVGDGGTGASDAAGARTNLGLGTMAVQNSNAVAITGGTISGITPLPITSGGTGSGTSIGARASLGLGSMSTQNMTGVNIAGGTISGITDLAVGDGGTGASTAAGARTNLGIGTIATQNSDYITVGGIGIINYQLNTPGSALALQAISGTVYSSNGVDVPVADGGTGRSSAVAYAPVIGGTTDAGAHQSASTGMSNTGYVLTSNGASSAPSWQATPVSSYVFVEQSVISTPVSAVSFSVLPIVDTYRFYTLHMHGINASISGTIYLQFSTDNGATWLSSSQNIYVTTELSPSGTAPAYSNSVGTSAIPLMGVSQLLTLGLLEGDFTLTNHPTHDYSAFGNSSYYASAGMKMADVRGRVQNSGVKFNAFRVIHGTGTMTQGTFTLYGIR